jgi:hypothetical protein
MSPSLAPESSSPRRTREPDSTFMGTLTPTHEQQGPAEGGGVYIGQIQTTELSNALPHNNITYVRT